MSCPHNLPAPGPTRDEIRPRARTANYRFAIAVAWDTWACGLVRRKIFWTDRSNSVDYLQIRRAFRKGGWPLPRPGASHLAPLQFLRTQGPNGLPANGVPTGGRLGEAIAKCATLHAPRTCS